jgi:hypothetical protein
VELTDRPLTHTAALVDGAQAPHSRIWAVGNLRGRAGGYRRGTLSLAGVTGAIRVALSCAVPVQDIQAVLDQYELHWEPAADRTVDRRTPAN